MTTTLRAFVILSAVTLGACGPTLQYPTASRQSVAQEETLNRELAAKLLQERVNRLARVYAILRTANADLCGEKLVPVVGLRLLDPSMAPGAEQRALMKKLYGLQTDTVIVDVAPNSPAAEAGLKAGDLILNVARASKGIANEYSLRPVAAQEIQKAFVDGAGEPIMLLVRRGTSMERVTVRSLLGCPYPINVGYTADFNAASDGQSIAIGTGVFNVAGDDSELAFVVAHELAHNILKHVEKSQGNAAIGGLIGLSLDIAAAAAGVNTQGLGWKTGAQAGAKAYSQEFERETDYLAIFMLSRAGYDTAKAPTLFRRLSAEYPGMITQNYLATHPSNPERIAAMQEAITEIRDKTSRGDMVLPATLEGQALAVRPINQIAPKPGSVIASSQIQQPTAVIQSTAFVTGTSAPQPIISQPTATHPMRASTGIRALAQLYLIKGPIVTNPPQTFSAEFFDGKAEIILSGRRRLTGEFELFTLGESIKAKYKPGLINPDSMKLSPGADAKGFAALSDGAGSQLECVYSLIRATGRGEGTCADNQRNTYSLVFD
jgi:hypothetical protein